MPTKSPMLIISPQYQSGPNLVFGTSKAMSLRPGNDRPTLYRLPDAAEAGLNTPGSAQQNVSPSGAVTL